METYKLSTVAPTNGFKHATFSVSTEETLPSVTSKRIIIEIDQSGSMSQNCDVGFTRLQKVTDTVEKIVSYLFRPEYNGSNVWIGVNSYNDDHHVRIPPVLVTGLSEFGQTETMDRFHQLLTSIRPDGMTNIEKPVKSFVEGNHVKQVIHEERKTCLGRINEIKESLFKPLSPSELVDLSRQLTETSEKLQSLPEFEDYLILLTDGQITRGLNEERIIDQYLSQLSLEEASMVYFIGFGKEHSASGLNKMDRGIGNYFGVINGAEATAIAAAEIIFRIVNPGLKNIRLSVSEGNAQFYDAMKNQWVSQLSMGMLTPGKTTEFYTRIPEAEEQSCIEFSSNSAAPVGFFLDGELTPERAEYGALRLETLQVMSETKQINERFSSIDYPTRTKDDLFRTLYQRSSTLLEKMEASPQSTVPEMVDLFNDLKACQLTMGGFSGVSSLYAIGRLNAQWFGSCMRNTDISAADITAHMYDSTGVALPPTQPVSLGRQFSESTPRCISDCMATLSQQQEPEEPVVDENDMDEPFMKIARRL